jgi:poly(3-hydroxybutyrate) depolymerase
MNASRYALTLLRLLLALAACAAQAAVPLPQLGVDLSQASVSGLSSGGFMAVQMHVAYSATFARGAGIVAGGPFHCAEGSAFNATGRCMAHSSPIPVASLAATTQGWARSGDIDPPRHLAASKVFLYSGSADRTVRPAVMGDLLDYYRRFVPAARIAVRNDVASGHAMITDDFGGSCAASELPFIADCDFDLAGAILGHLYGPLQARNDGAPRGSLIEFDQTPFVRGHGMASAGWLYVPQECAATGRSGAARCRLHVVFHGCKQNPAYIGQQYVRHAGYNRWADGNAIVMLYPQTGGIAVNGCWDWWGYDSANYARKSGPQMAAVKAMVDTLAAPPGAPPAASCHTDSNYAHTTAGRAHVSFGLALANGSNQGMGWWNVFTITTLKQTAPGYYVVGSCP